MVNSWFSLPPPPPPPPTVAGRLLNYKRRDLIWSGTGSWTMDNAVSRLDNGELKQGVRFVMRRHTLPTVPPHTACRMPHATCHLPRSHVVLAKKRAVVAKQILLLFNCNQIISTRFFASLRPLSVARVRARSLSRFQFTNVAPNERVLNIIMLEQLHPQTGCGPAQKGVTWWLSVEALSNNIPEKSVSTAKVANSRGSLKRAVPTYTSRYSNLRWLIYIYVEFRCGFNCLQRHCAPKLMNMWITWAAW